MFDFLFGRKKGNEAAAPSSTPVEPPKPSATAPGTAISYRPDLIDQLKRDHQALLALFGTIQEAFKEGRIEEVVRGLENFRVAIQSHLLMENVRLYIYLEHQLAGDAGSHQLIHEFRLEMDGIGKAVMGFLAKYRDLSVDKNLVGSFGRDLEGVGKVLVGRIQREEATLYPLYLPAY